MDFLKNKDKIWSRTNDQFCGHLYTGIVFSYFFTRPRKKTWYRWRFGSAVNIIFDFGSTQKWAKNDASLSVDAFDGVRDGDRIRASGDVLFFHIVQFKSSNCFHMDSWTIFDAFSAQAKIFHLNENRWFSRKKHDPVISLHVARIKSSEIMVYKKWRKKHHKMNVCRSVDGIGSGTGTGCKMNRKMDCGLHLFLYIVKFVQPQC